jgi:hypothetical protein
MHTASVKHIGKGIMWQCMHVCTVAHVQMMYGMVMLPLLQLAHYCSAGAPASSNHMGFGLTVRVKTNPLRIAHTHIKQQPAHLHQPITQGFDLRLQADITIADAHTHIKQQPTEVVQRLR